MKFSLRYTVPMALLIFTIALALWSLKVNGKVAMRQVEADISSKLTVALTLLQENVEYGFHRGSLERIQKEISVFGSGNYMKSLVLIDETGKVIGGTQFVQIGSNIKSILSEEDANEINKKIEIAKSQYSGTIFVSDDRATIWGIYPVKIDFKEGYIRPTRTGALVAQIDLMGLKKVTFNLVQNQIIQFYSFLSVLVIVLGIFIHYRITRRIQQLVSATESFSSGDFQSQINVGGSDEITLLAEAMTKMAETRIHADKKLQESEKNYKHLFGQLRSIVEGTSSRDSKQYFSLLTKFLAHALNVRYVFIGELKEGDTEQVKTLSVWAGEGYAENFIYSLAGTPCENVIGQSLCCYPKDIQKYFPGDILLKEKNIEGYLGIPLFDSLQKPMGILTVMDDRPIVDQENSKIILSIFAKQVESEMERKNTDDELKESRKMLQLVIDTIPMAIFWKDKDFRFLGCNRHMADNAGLSSPEEIIGKEDYALMWREHADLYRSDDNRVIQSGIPKLHYEEPLNFENGNKLWIRTCKVPLRNIEGAITGVLGTFEDITLQKEAEKELQRYRDHLEELVGERTQEIQLAKNALEASQKTYSNLLSNLNGMVYRCKNDKDWTMEFVSKGALELTGYKSEEIEQNNKISYNEIIHENDRERIWSDVQEALGNCMPFVLNYRIKTAKGSEKWVWEQGRGIFSSSGELEALEGYITDITKQVEAEQSIKDSQAKLIHAEKLTALGKLTGSIAHEFNNPLQGIKSIMEIFESSGLSDEKLKLAVLGRKECDRMAKMIRDLQNFYKPSSATISSININKCIEDVLTLQTKSLEQKHIQVKQQLDDQLPNIEVVEDQIKQVLLNLIQNAADAIVSSEGKITLTTEKRGSFVMIKVQDTGSGVSEDDIKSIFEPFYTTKGVKGTGLGLSISYGIIKNHGGNILVASELGKGAIFTVSLPLQRSKEKDAL